MLYEALGIPVAAVLTDNARDFYGRPDRHPLLLVIEEHRHPQVPSSRTNGFWSR